MTVEESMRAALYRRTMSGHLDWLTVGSLVQRHGCAAAGVEAHCLRTGLHIAVGEDKADYVRLLVARGADVSARCGLGLTPLLLAVVRGHAASADALLELGAGGDGGELDACICIGRYLGHTRIVDALLLRASRSPLLRRKHGSRSPSGGGDGTPPPPSPPLPPSPPPPGTRPGVRPGPGPWPVRSRRTAQAARGGGDDDPRQLDE